MRKEQFALPLALTGVLIVGGLAVALALLAPDRLRTALVGGLTLPLLWSLVELMTKGDKTVIRFAVTAGAGLLTLSLGTKVAQAAGWIGPDEAGLGLRLFGIAGGLLLAFYGNRIPKVLQRYDPTADPGRRQAFQRQAGWTFVLAGLGSALLWMVLPVDGAVFWATAIVAGATALVLARVIRCRLRGRNA